MQKARARDMSGSETDWRSATNYRVLLHTDRRGFAWEWLRRHAPYRKAWTDRAVPATNFGLLAFVDPNLSLSSARPIWADSTDPSVLSSHPANAAARVSGDAIDIRVLSQFVSVEIDEADNEHWLLSDGHWVVRLDLYDGTLLAGPALLKHSLVGFRSARPQLTAFRQLSALVESGQLPAMLKPREARAARWIMELRTADALLGGATQQEMARSFYGSSVAARWREDNSSYRMRIQRLVRTARHYLGDPLSGPWFDC